MAENEVSSHSNIGQEGMKSNLQIVLHALTVVSGNLVLSALITNSVYMWYFWFKRKCWFTK